MTRIDVSLAIVVLLGVGVSTGLVGQEAASAPWSESGADVMTNLPDLAKYRRADVVQLCLEVSQELLADGVVVSRFRERWLAQTARGVGALKVADIPYRADSMTVESVRARTIRPDGTEIQATAITDFKPSTPGPLSWDMRTRRIGFPSVCVGAVVEYEAALRTSPELALPILSGQLSLRRMYPVLSQVYTFSVPTGQALNWEVLGSDPVVAEPSGDGRSVRLALGDVWAEKVEDQMPCTDEAWPGIRYSSLGSWAELADRMRTLLADDTSADPAVLDMTNDLLAGVPTEGEIVDRLFGFVRDEIEYYALFFGDGGYDAASSAETLQKRRGDCKAMTVLLVTMLRHAGVEAYPALASATCTLNGAFGGIPWMSQALNHVVTAVQTEDGRWRILDPTCAPCAPSYCLQSGQTVWILNGERGTPGTALALPESEAEANRVHVIVGAALDAEGSLSANAAIAVTGDLAPAYTMLLEKASQATLATLFSGRLCTVLPPQSAPSVAAGDVHIVSMWDPVEVRIHYSDPEYLDLASDNGVVLPCFPEIVSGPYSPLYPEPTPAREYPLLVGASVWEYDLVLRLPQDWLVQQRRSRAGGMYSWVFELPASVEQSYGDATYRATCTFAGGALTVHRELIVARTWIAPANYNDLAEVVRTAEQSMMLLFRFAPPR